jgi:hypothetical protein
VRVSWTREYTKHLRKAVQPLSNPGAVLTLDDMFEGVVTAPLDTKSTRRVPIEQNEYVKPGLALSTSMEDTSVQQTTSRTQFFSGSQTFLAGTDQQTMARYTGPPRVGGWTKRSVPGQRSAPVQRSVPGQRSVPVQCSVSAGTMTVAEMLNGLDTHSNRPKAPCRQPTLQSSSISATQSRIHPPTLEYLAIPQIPLGTSSQLTSTATTLLELRRSNSSSKCESESSGTGVIH